MTFALIDCNNFYAACERVFDPKLAGRPVVVLSNNDGCVVSRSAEAKAMGVPMAAPYFKIEREFVRRGGVALSSNYALYADMSNRVMSILAGFSPHQEVYSIDECFLGMEGFKDLAALGRGIRIKVGSWTGLPVCVGFAPTKTLAKLANHVAKKQPAWGGVCDLTALSRAEQEALIGCLDVGEVWGVGRKLRERLIAMGIDTVGRLRAANPTRIRKAFNVVLERTVCELNGTPCLDLEAVPPPKQQVMVSRSFGAPIYHLTDLQEAVATFAGRAAEKLRGQGCCTGALTVFIHTSPFKREEPQYSPSLTLPLPLLTADTLELTRMALAALDMVYRPGYAYAKAGVLLSELVPLGKVQPDLFAVQSKTGGKPAALMAVIDRANARFGRGALKSAATITQGRWCMQQRKKSPSYTTKWGDLLRLRAP